MSRETYLITRKDTRPLPLSLWYSPPMPPPLQVFIALFIVGVLLRSFQVLTKAHAERLATFVFSISLPATILLSLDRVSVAPTAWKLPLAAGLVTLPLLCCSWQLVRLSQFPRTTQGGFLLATGSINSVYFAYPMAQDLFPLEPDRG